MDKTKVMVSPPSTDIIIAMRENRCMFYKYLSPSKLDLFLVGFDLFVICSNSMYRD